MTKQHSSSMYVGLLPSTSSLSLFCLFSSSSSGSCAASWERVLYCILDAVRESTISMQLERSVYISKHRFREFTKQTWTTLQFDLNSVSFFLCDANWEFLFDSACTTKIASSGEYKMVAEGNTSSDSKRYWKPLISFCLCGQKGE